MITREFHCSFIWDVVMHEDGYGKEPLPENTEVVKETDVHYGVWTETTIIFKLIDEFKFYRVNTKYNARRESLDIENSETGEWVKNGFTQCTEVVPHIKQIVVYDEVEDVCA